MLLTRQGRDLRLLRDYIKRFRDAVTSHGGKLIVVLLPTKEQVFPRYLSEVVQASQIDPVDMLAERIDALPSDEEARIGLVDLLDALTVPISIHSLLLTSVSPLHATP